MNFELTADQHRLHREITDYLQQRLTPELEAELLICPEGGGPDTHPHYNALLRQMGKDGWLGLGWPAEYGGQGRSAIDQYVFFDTVMGYYGLPLPMLALNTVGPTLMKHGTDDQRQRFLPPILTGELNIAIGYTEPASGTDLASLQTRAVRDGDHYIINGQKVFTSLAHHCDYIWLAARTDPDVKKHKGISIFMVDINSPGITVNPINAMGGFRSNATFYDDVRVPVDCLIGEENRGWSYINSQLAMERVGLVPHSKTGRHIELMTAWAKDNTVDGCKVIEKPWVRSKLADLTMRMEVLKLFNYRVAWQITQGIESMAEASMTKVFGTELMQDVTGSCMEMMGLHGGLQPPDELAPSRGRIQRDFLTMRLLTFGGGSNEVLRDLIALFAIGLPPSR
jgi:3-oxocholest-4-en-26-oyl-CoA dehydrogenase alpha subunit